MIVLVKEESPQINDTLNIIINEDEIATGKVEAILEQLKTLVEFMKEVMATPGRILKLEQKFDRFNKLAII